ncbi:RNA metabolism protein [Lithospermum erythrorhizon]|uniref:RNA metabolism protein n=1 Tax=Lithospermum erythrorhizon TaxID=34254 RepID=A0AAV3QD28_LITER
MSNQGYVGKSAYRPPLSSPVRNLENSHVSESPNRSLGPLSHAVKESDNSTGLSNLGTVHVTLVLSELIRTNDNKISELTHIAGHYVELRYSPEAFTIFHLILLRTLRTSLNSCLYSKDHYGSRFIQQKLETAKKVEKDMVFREIKPHALTLMTDVFGNYVVQKFFDYGSKQQVRELVNRMAACVYRFSLAIYSCRVIQKAIESIEVDLKIKLAGELEGHVLKCVQDKNGNHVIQKCIKHVPEHAIQFILSPILEQVRALCIHEYGCRVIQRVLESCHSQKTQRIALDEIMQSVTELVDDCYGNYILQHILQRGHPQVCSEIIKKLTGQMVSMSTLKYSSNVIEKCVTYSSLEERKKIVDEILDFSGGIDAFQVMMTNPYGNYVVQRVLETCDELQLNQVLDRIRVHLNALRSHRYGKRILARLEQLVVTGGK